MNVSKSYHQVPLIEQNGFYIRIQVLLVTIESHDD